MLNISDNETALQRMLGMLEYVEQLIKLDEKVAQRLEQHVLPDGSRFVLHQHELHGLPGIHLDGSDEDGPVWLRMERLVRVRAPEIAIELASWLNISQDLDKPCIVNETVSLRVDRQTRDQMLSEGNLFEAEFQPSLKDEPDADGKPRWFDLILRLENRPERRAAIDAYIADQWLPWSESERPRRRSIAVYQRLFEIAQHLTTGNADQSELVCGIGLSRWKKNGVDIDIPVLARALEIQIHETRQAEITIRPRSLGAQIELRAFQDIAAARFNQAEDAARRSLKTIETTEPEGVSPFRSETFEPVLRQCSSQLDPEGSYLPDGASLAADKPVPASIGNALEVSNRFVLFARRRTSHVVVADIEKLKASIKPDGNGDTPELEGAARTLVLGPQDGVGSGFVPLGSIGSSQDISLPDEPDSDHDHGDLFFPKPFNDDQVQIVRRLEKSDGIVVQGPPGTGKTHTIANIISHMLATGKRVLVISHGEMALSVIRDQLPEQLRDLAISITTSERDGERQVERAVDVMLRIVNEYSADGSKPIRRIKAVEASIVADRKRLTEIDADLAEIAGKHLTKVDGDGLAYERALRLMDARDEHQWFDDRPGSRLEALDVDVGRIDEAMASAARLRDDLRYMGVELAAPAGLPQVAMLDIWRADLLQAKAIGSSLAYANEIRRILSTRQTEGAEELLGEIRALTEAWRQVEHTPWSASLFEQARGKSPIFSALKDEFSKLSSTAAELHARVQPFIERRVDLPAAMPPREDVATILGSLATGKDPFGMFAFKLKAHKPAISAIQINGERPQSADDWRHVSGFLALRSDMDALANRWSQAFSSAGVASAPTPAIGPTLGALSAVVRDALALPDRLGELQKKLARATESYDQAGIICSSAEHLSGFADALAAKLSQSRLTAVRARIDGALAKIPRGDLDVHQTLRHVLQRLDDPEADAETLFQSWTAALAKIEHVRASQTEFEQIGSASERLIDLEADKLAARMREGGMGPDSPDWKAAWNWWVDYGYLSKIGEQERLRALHKERTDTEARLRQAFGDLVRERAFYELANSMPGMAKSALKAFADIVRRLGKGTGKRSAMHRRDLRQTMDNCYSAVPCWIMPAWRVSEQLPAAIGSFDLVILDEASQSDAREIPALLRGKKILVVGDDRQVSPGASFIKIDDIERLQMNYLQTLPFPTQLLPGSSIYDLARVMFPDKFVMLKEHFRCVEPIIRFSMQFYNEPLIPLRIPTAAERLDPPLIDILVKDGRRRGKQKINDREAEVIIDEIEALIGDPVLSHVRTPQNERPRSIGVISLIGGDQARFIQQKLIERIGEPKFVEHKIVCGDSASLQGNERDVVFLSMIADGEGRVTSATAQQFEQRFNVALSRARDRMVLVRSVEESRLNPVDLKAKIIRHFRDPMPAVRASADELIEQCQSGFERSVFTFLRDNGFNVRPQVGSQGYFIDMVVEGEGGRRLAIECDGDLYHGPDRWADDMRRQRILERVGWRFWRVFASTYALDPEGVKADLLRTLEAHGIKTIRDLPTANVWTEHRIVELVADISERKVPSLLPGMQDLPVDVPVDVSPSEPTLVVGDQVVLRYLDKPNARPVFYLITKDASDQSRGLLSLHSPLGKLLSEYDEGEEFIFKAGDEEQRILFMAKQGSSSMRLAAE